jgi:RHH-type proline utilization regulon transcriptional repressor/proline dehydrogenase/delta 1-pyrroline-5-carboxylate dehydrogenase
VRLIAAATRAEATLTISTALPLPASLVELFERPFSPVDVSAVTVESDDRWIARLRDEAIETPRIRLIGAGEELTEAITEIIGRRADIALYTGPVTTAGRVEMLPFLLEQSVSITAHRFGTLDPELSELRL